MQNLLPPFSSSMSRTTFLGHEEKKVREFEEAATANHFSINPPLTSFTTEKEGKNRRFYIIRNFAILSTFRKMRYTIARSFIERGRRNKKLYVAALARARVRDRSHATASFA